ncbi:MAG: amino acid adenylation domain-containing protein [Verrucomicrobia bacterium]|nr:amino acid adenylation domain-containing protein [Verrucomicrobiota bacterium]
MKPNPQSNPKSLKERIASLDPNQRKCLLEKLEKGNGNKQLNGLSATLGKAEPLFTERVVTSNGAEEEVKVFAVSHTQERMFFLHEFAEDIPVYSSPMAFRFEGLVDAEKLNQAFKAVIRRHASLRTTFYMGEIGLYQRVHPAVSFELNQCSVSQSTDKSETEALSELMAELVCEHFDLEKGPLLRAHLVNCESGAAILLIVIHHIISDGWSRANLCKELSFHYDSALQEVPIDKAEMLLQYADFAFWQNEYLQRNDFQDHLDYWKEKLSGKLDPIDFSFDFKRPKDLSNNGAELTWDIDTSLIEKLKQLASEEGGTLYMILLAAFNVLLHRYSDQEEIIVGTQVANRHRKEVECLIGCFINTLAIRTNLSGAQNFKQLFKRVKAVCLDAFTHQEVPFERLLGELEIDRDTGRNPVFQTLFSLQDFEEVSLSLGGSHSSVLPVHTNTSKVELHMLVQPSKDGWSCVIEYNTDLFGSDRIERLFGHWKVLLNAIAEDTGISIANVPLLSDTEREALLYQWNDTAGDYPLDSCVHKHFEDQVDRTPDAIAVVFEGKRLSYKELNNEANKLAHRLEEIGVGPEQLVGLLNNRSIEMFVGLLAILKAGGAYVPIDEDLPSSRIKDLIEDAGIKLLLTNEGGEDLSESLKIPVFRIRDDEISKNYSSANLVSSVDSRNLAYVLYTSGSTGKPKGVTVEHRQIVNYIFGVSEVCELRAGNFAMIQPLTVDSTQTMLFPAWLCGGTIHLISKMDSLDAAALKNYFTKQSIDYLKIAPTHLTALLASVRTVDLLPKRGLLMGGEALSISLIKDIESLNPPCRIWNHYGPTETTVGVLINEVKFQNDAFHGTIPLGQSLPNTSVHILDPKGELVPIGLRGEIFIGGESVTRGYLDREELTNSVFLKSTFEGPLNQRLYKTGDFGRRLSDGRIEYLGRADGQIKIRGFRVELGEIESVLRGHPEVIDARVLAAEDYLKSLQLVAFTVLGVGATESSESLMVYLSENLPPQMVPASIHVLDSMPRSAQGKMDSKTLLAISRAALLEGDSIQDSNLTLLEEELQNIWIEVLGASSANPAKSFFEMGGNSLTATLVIARLRKTLKVEIPIREFFNSPTIKGVADYINREFGELESIQAFSPVKISETENVLSCFVIGDGRMPIEIVGVLQKHGVRICGIFTTDQAILNWAIEEGIRAVGPEVEIKTFLETEPFDYLFSVVNPRILKEDVLSLPQKMAINFHDGPLPRYAGVNAPSWGIINQQSDHGVTWHEIVPEIDAGDILKQVTFSLSNEETFLSLGLKCVEAGVNALDGLLDDLKGGNLEKKKQNTGLRTYFKAIDRPTPASILLWEKTAEELDAIRRGQDFGPLFNSMGTIKLYLGEEFLIVGKFEVVNEHCDEIPGSILSIDDSSLKIATSNKPIRILELHTIDGERLTLDHLFILHKLKVGSVLPGLNKLQSDRFTRASNAIIRNDGFWRNRLVDLRPVSFLKLNSSYNGSKEFSTTSNSISIKLGPKLSISTAEETATRINYLVAAWCAFVARVGGEDIFDIEFSPIKNYNKWSKDSSLVSPYIPLRITSELDESFSEFQKTLNAELSTLERRSVFGRDLVFRDPKLVAQDDLRKLHKLPIAIWHVPEISHPVSIDGLECVLLLDEDGEQASLVFNEKLIKPQLAENLVKWFNVFLEDLEGKEESRIDSIRLLSDADAENLSRFGHGEISNYPINTSIHGIFEVRVLEQPDAIAVEQGDSRLSYLQLNSLSNSLAHHLIEKGVLPDTQVGIFLERSPAMIVSILAVLKAGGASRYFYLAR